MNHSTRSLTQHLRRRLLLSSKTARTQFPIQKERTHANLGQEARIDPGFHLETTGYESVLGLSGRGRSLANFCLGWQDHVSRRHR